jgi:predicted ATPase
VLVSGYSGIGKSSVVHELHKVLVAPRGLFASGKFDQYKRDIPYATLAQALRSLIRPLLGKSESELRDWSSAFREALDPNGLLIANLVPELKLIVEEQPPVHELVEKPGLERFQARTYLWFAQFVVPWTKHVQACRELIRRAFDAATKVGDLTVAVYSCDNLNTNFLAVGDRLDEAQREAESGLRVCREGALRFRHRHYQRTTGAYPNSPGFDSQIWLF